MTNFKCKSNPLKVDATLENWSPYIKSVKYIKLNTFAKNIFPAGYISILFCEKNSFNLMYYLFQSCVADIKYCFLHYRNYSLDNFVL